MYRPRNFSPRPRRGIILLVVLSMLTLFAVVGLTFVFYADAESAASRTAREAENVKTPDVDPEMAFSLFLKALIFDQADDASGAFSAGRGHSLIRNMFGWNPATANDVPFNGVGRLHEPITFGMNPAVDGYYLVNYQAFLDANGNPVDAMIATLPPSQGGIRDPERLGVRANLAAAPGAFTGGFNVGYTYADYNSMFLAAVKADGTVLVPSFHRPWGPFGALNPANPNWLIPSSTDPALKRMVLRPRPIDQLLPGETWPPNRPYFPLPDDPGGDVKNLLGAPGGNDSFWMDWGAPVMTMADGRKYKMLFAPLIVDMDGKANVNAHGNIRGQNNSSLSNFGFGPWEVNLEKVFYKQTAEAQNLFVGKAQNNTTYKWGRYGKNQLPTDGQSSAPGGSGVPHFYAQVDFDGSNEGQGGVPSGMMILPGGANGPAKWSCFPTYPAGYGNNVNASAESKNHPLLYNVFKTAAYDANNDDLVFPASNLAALLRYGDTGSEFLTSDLTVLCPNNFSDPRIRRLVTTHSFDPNRPGAAPWVYSPRDPASAAYLYQLTGQAPQGAAIPFPTLDKRANANPTGSSFAADWRAQRVTRAQNATKTTPAFAYDSAYRVDVNQSLPAFPAAGNNGLIDMTNMANVNQYTTAQNARINLAAQLYYTLVLATGAFDPFTQDSTAMPPITPNASEVNALRWLAQLAANMVDYLDADDYSTPFNWGVYGSAEFVKANAGEWVYGTELPRVVLNEVYMEYTNDPKDPGILNQNVKVPTRYIVNVWAELHNPFNADPTLPDPILGANVTSVGRLQLADGNNNNAPTTPVYKLLITDKNTSLRNPNNTLGTPDAAILNNNGQGLSTWSPGNVKGVDTTIILPSSGKYASPSNQGSNDGFYMVGPPVDFPSDPTIKDPKLVPPKATLNRPEMSYTYTIAGGIAAPPPPTLILQRLACPNLPAQADPTKPLYNPFISVDYLEPIPMVMNNAAAVGPQGGNQVQPPVTGRYAWGKPQPYASNPGLFGLPTSARQFPQLKANATTTPVIAANSQYPNQPQHSFFQHNVSASTGVGPNSAVTGDWPPAAPTNYPTFDWLTHMDRSLASPLDLLQVSGYKPHELTQQFVTGPNNNQRFQHRVDWFNDLIRVYRFFEFVQTHPLGAGVSKDGRVPGRINLNSIWDPETFLALCDPQVSSYFSMNDLYRPLGTSPNVDPTKDDPVFPTTVYWRMIQLKTGSADLTTVFGPNGNDAPFTNLAGAPYVAAGDTQYPKGSGTQNTFFRPAGGGGRLFQKMGYDTNQNQYIDPDPAGHPFLKSQLMGKIFNNVTVRSNVFAVWVTVGFFEVIDDTVRPVKLGAELGRSENRHVRHRMFALIDRSVLSSNPGPQPRFNPHDPKNAGLILYFSLID